MTDFACAARKAVGANDPQECDWPHCGCDERALRVLEALTEEGYRSPSEVSALEIDNKALTNALQRIEAGEPDPVEIARTVLDSPARKALFG